MARPALLVLSLALGVSLSAPARAQADGERHLLEVAVGGGMSWQSADPTRMDVAPGGQLSARAMVDVTHARLDARYLMLDPSRPDWFDLRGDARLLFVTVHDVTWRRTADGELLRLFAGLGGEIDLPDDFGHLMLNVGFAMTRFGGYDGVERPLTEAYGAYAGVTGRIHFGPVRDELRIAVHGMTVPPELSLELALEPMQVFDDLVAGVTASNRLYVEVIAEDVITVGPELFVSIEQLVDGPVIQGTLGVSGTLGL